MNKEFSIKCVKALIRADEKNYQVLESWLLDPKLFISHMWNLPGGIHAVSRGFVIKRHNLHAPFAEGNTGWAMNQYCPIMDYAEEARIAKKYSLEN